MFRHRLRVGCTRIVQPSAWLVPKKASRCGGSYQASRPAILNQIRTSFEKRFTMKFLTSFQILDLSHGIVELTHLGFLHLIDLMQQQSGNGRMITEAKAK